MGTPLLPLLVGCGLLAFGPSIAFLWVVVSQRAQLVIIALSGAFFWLTAILLSALVWYLFFNLTGAPKLYGVIIPISVAIQEYMRYLLYVAYVKAETAIRKVTTPTATLPLHDITSSLAGGVGFGTMQGVIMYGSVLAASSGPSVLFSESCPHMPLVFLSAVTCLCFIVLHTMLMIAAFVSFRRQNRAGVGMICAAHLAASYITVINTVQDGCRASLPLLVILVTAVSAFVILRIRDRSFPVTHGLVNPQ